MGLGSNRVLIPCRLLKEHSVEGYNRWSLDRLFLNPSTLRRYLSYWSELLVATAVFLGAVFLMCSADCCLIHFYAEQKRSPSYGVLYLFWYLVNIIGRLLSEEIARTPMSCHRNNTIFQRLIALPSAVKFTKATLNCLFSLGNTYLCV